MSKSNNKDELYADKIIRSNNLITSKYSSTLIENQLMVACMKSAKLDEHNRPVVELTTEEIRKLTGVKGNGLYSTLKDAAQRMIGRTIYMENIDDSGKSFRFLNLIHMCEYKNGKFRVFFTPETSSMLYNLRQNFTSISISQLFSFHRNCSFRLFEILSTLKYKIGKNNYPYTVIYSLSDLKLQLNCINVDETRVKAALSKPNPDLDKIVNEIAIEKKFTRWSDFKSKVLDVAKNEINDVSDLYIDFSPIKVGRGGKVVKVEFYIQHNVGQDHIIWGEENLKEGLITKEMERASLLSDVYDILSEVSVSSKEAYSLLNAADNDLEKIKKAYSLSKKQGHIKNFIGWMIRAIKEDYSESIEVIEGSEAKAQRVNEIRETINNNYESLAAKTWSRIKEKEYFPEFANYIEQENGFDIVTLESIYEPVELTKMFGHWFSQIRTPLSTLG